MANLLTALRLLLVVPAALAFARSDFLSPLLLLTLVSIAILTDYFDGIVARRTNTASPRGQLFDHTTDFLFVTSGLAGAAIAGQVPPALPVLIVVAFSQYVLDSHFFYREKRLHISFLGRWNGMLYFVPLVLIAVSRLDLVAGVVGIFSTLVGSLSYLLVLSTVASIIDRAIAPRRAHRLGQGAQPGLR
jgi:CDP-diacylglycerol--glycerol-3-phosphate 3-phosphatidyltransferase